MLVPHLAGSNLLTQQATSHLGGGAPSLPIEPSSPLQATTGMAVGLGTDGVGLGLKKVSQQLSVDLPPDSVTRLAVRHELNQSVPALRPSLARLARKRVCPLWLPHSAPPGAMPRTAASFACGRAWRAASTAESASSTARIQTSLAWPRRYATSAAWRQADGTIGNRVRLERCSVAQRQLPGQGRREARGTRYHSSRQGPAC